MFKVMEKCCLSALLERLLQQYNCMISVVGSSVGGEQNA